MKKLFMLLFSKAENAFYKKMYFSLLKDKKRDFMYIPYNGGDLYLYDFDIKNIDRVNGIQDDIINNKVNIEKI